MRKICPLCNGLDITQYRYCPFCHNLLEEKGAISDYLGPYSPYEDTSLINEKGNNNNFFCTHLFTCENCVKDIHIKVALINY